MLRTVLVCVVLTSISLVPHFSGADEPAGPAASWISQDAILTIQITRPREIIERVFDEPVVQAIQASPQYKEQVAKPEFQQVDNVVKYFEGRYGMDLPTLLGKLTGGGITFVLGPNEASMLIVEAEDEKMLSEVHEFFLLIAKNEAQQQGNSDRVTSSEYRGITGWKFAPKEAHAIVGNRFLLTNTPAMLKTAADLRAEPDRPNLASLAAYQAATGAAGPDAVATVYANMEVLKHVPQLEKAFSGNENPLAALLLGPLVPVLRDASWLGLGLKVDGDVVSLELTTDGAPGESADPENFAVSESPDGGALPNLSVPGQIAALTLYRDLYRFYAAKDDLFPERTSGLIFFENMMGIFFTGRDLTEEVLAGLSPEVRVVVARQEYDPAVGTPRVQLPGFAAVFRMHDPQKFTPVAEEAWQKALGLINFTRGQNAEPGLILDRPVHGDTKYTMAYFSAADEEDRSAVDARFNFQPSIAMPGDYLILSSTDALAKDLIDTLSQEAAGSIVPLPGTHSLLEVDGSQVSSILQANSEALIRQNMVKEGHSREEAEPAIGLMLKIADSIRMFKLSAANRDGQSQAKLELHVSLPSSN